MSDDAQGRAEALLDKLLNYSLLPNKDSLGVKLRRDIETVTTALRAERSKGEQAERERCLKVVDKEQYTWEQINSPDGEEACQAIAQAIREQATRAGEEDLPTDERETNP